jgi:hypothetical protein
MREPAILSIISFLLVMLMVYLWASKRNLIKNRAVTPQEYLWRLKDITCKSEYELFHIAAEEKGWPGYQVERHFKRYLEDQTLPDYVKEFLEDGKEYINAYRPTGGNFFDKRLVIFYSLFGLLLIGGSFVLCLYIFPRIFPFGPYDSKAIPKLAKPYIYRAAVFADNRKYEKACLELKRACELGACEYYNMKKREGVCQ